MKRRGLLLPALTALMTAIALFVLAGYQVTTETAATRLLSRFSASLVEFDRWLPQHLEDLQLMARDRPEGAIEIRDLPIRVVLPARQVIGADETALRGPILSLMAGSLYEDGNGAFRDAEGKQRSPGVDQPSYWTARLLNEDAHGFWRAALPFTFLVLLAFCASVLHSGRSLAAVITVGAGFAALASLGVWLLASALSSSYSSPVDKEIMLILRDGAWIGVRNAFAVLGASLGLLFIFRFLEDERPRQALSSRTIYPPDSPFA
jgi:hypothetical protein